MAGGFGKHVWFSIISNKIKIVSAFKYNVGHLNEFIKVINSLKKYIHNTEN